MGRVCPTSHFKNRTPVNKGRNEDRIPKNSRFYPRTGKDGLTYLIFPTTHRAAETSILPAAAQNVVGRDSLNREPIQDHKQVHVFEITQ
jgi:hypothetical protein